MGEVGVLGQEPVAGVDCVGSDVHGGPQDLLARQIGIGCGHPGQRNRDVGGLDVQRVGVWTAVHRHGRNAHRPGRFDDAAGDLPAVGDEKTSDHPSSLGAGECRDHLLTHHGPVTNAGLG